MDQLIIHMAMHPGSWDYGFAPADLAAAAINPDIFQSELRQEPAPAPLGAALD